MNIVWNKDSKKRNFSELNIGETFSYAETLFMKVKPIANSDGMVWNAVNFDKGQMTKFRNDDIVIARSCTITVEE